MDNQYIENTKRAKSKIICKPPAANTHAIKEGLIAMQAVAVAARKTKWMPG